MKTQDVLKELEISRQRLNQIVNDGRIRFTKKGRVNEYNKKDVMAYKEDRFPLAGKRIDHKKKLDSKKQKNKIVETIIEGIKKDDETCLEYAIDALNQNLLEADASTTKFILSKMDERFMSLEEKLEKQAIIHITKEW